MSVKSWSCFLHRHHRTKALTRRSGDAGDWLLVLELGMLAGHADVDAVVDELDAVDIAITTVSSGVDEHREGGTKWEREAMQEGWEGVESTMRPCAQKPSAGQGRQVAVIGVGKGQTQSHLCRPAELSPSPVDRLRGTPSERRCIRIGRSTRDGPIIRAPAQVPLK